MCARGEAGEAFKRFYERILQQIQRLIPVAAQSPCNTIQGSFMLSNKLVELR